MTSQSLSDVDAVNRALVTIWRKYASDIKGRISWKNKTDPGKPHTMERHCPLQYPALKSGGIVFVGFNPSFSEKGWATVLKKAGVGGHDPGVKSSDLRSIFDFECSPESLEKVTKLEGLAHQHLDFFKFHGIASNRLNRPWAHIDLFAWRCTNQSYAKHLLTDNKTAHKPFAEAQLAVFNALLKLARPQAVVITNAHASRVYLEHRGIEETFDPSAGHYWDDIEGIGRVPVLPAGMLTGQRALDVYSRQRVLWQLGKVLKPAIDWNPGTEKPSEDIDG